MKELCYLREKKNSKIFNIVIILVVIGFLIGIGYLIYTGSKEIIEYAIFVFCIIFFLTIYIWITVADNEIRKKYKNIKENGIRYNGYIKSFYYNKYVANYNNNGARVVTEYDLNVVYGKGKEYTTPSVNFDPVNDLGSRECGVYVLDNEIYVSDFVKRQKGEDIIWDENDESVLQIKEKNKEFVKKSKAGIIISAIFLIGVAAWIIAAVAKTLNKY